MIVVIVQMKHMYYVLTITGLKENFHLLDYYFFYYDIKGVILKMICVTFKIFRKELIHGAVREQRLDL